MGASLGLSPGAIGAVTPGYAVVDVGTYGGEPSIVSDSAGQLYDTTPREGETYTFGGSGLLYRSNKLMADHQTGTLWSNQTGEPVLGPLAASGKRLPLLPLVASVRRADALGVSHGA